METWKGRKRPWEDDSPIDSQQKRRGSMNTTLAVNGSRQTSPLPQQAGYYSRDSRTLNQRRLPPLHTSSWITSAEPALTHSGQGSAHAQPAALLDHPRPRSQSLFNVLQHPLWHDHQDYSERPTISLRTPELDTSSPPPDTEAHWPRFGTDPAPHARGALICCPSNCQGEACASTRTLMRRLAFEVVLLEGRVKTITQTEHHSSNELSRPEQLNTEQALQYALDLVQWSNLNLQQHLDYQHSSSPQRLSQPEATPNMRRGQHYLEEREEQSPPSRQHPQPHHGYPGFTHPSAIPEESRRLPYYGEMSSMGNSPHHIASPSGSAFMPPQSPMQAPQPLRSAILPSPSALNFPNAPTLPSLSPPSAAGHTSAQSAHLQDLQHQISVKTLAFQTLQREYDSLLQKLERQRTKCATLEKKFEVSDVEINGLTDEKEKMQVQVMALEGQVEELQSSRDEARRQLVANGAQYMRIMEMANKLQAQGADDKKKWEAERCELEQRIRILEEAMVTGTEQNSSGAETRPGESPDVSSPVVLPHNLATPSASQFETINVLRAEVGRLRSRTHTLEAALQTMRRESISIQAAARQLVESGGRLEGVAHGAVGTDG
ncbi:hypothetical protein CC86DRAFT_67297 [Ophiobolus disseminans]|uniref:Uncharacterized protein n=1 Tax=Ophiobolus disseminans TaxID=1469910 RepID=A0A6A6ZQS5_9PLEO|nr:hypothetical protein CC86DRAFT_67297 [Ophiobolus disseminans]